MASWGGDRLAKIGQLPFLITAALAAFANARRLGAGLSAALLATTWFVAVFPLLLFTAEPNVDTTFVAGYLLAAYFFLRYALGDERVGALAIGALASGGVLGTKPTGIVFGGLLLGAAAIVVLFRGKSIGQAVGHLCVLLFLPLVMVGSWYGQNLWLTGNPLYPLHLQAFGRVWLAGWYGSDMMRMSPFYIPMSDWRALGDILLAVFDTRLIGFWAAALAGAWSWGRRGPYVAAGVWAFSALALANLAAYWILVPYRTQQRFMFQAIGLLVVPLACFFSRSRWLRMLATALLAIHLFTSQSWPLRPDNQDPPWDLTSLVPNAVPALIESPYLVKVNQGKLPDPDDISWTLVQLTIGAAALAGAWLWSRSWRRSHALALVGSLGLLALTIAMAYPYGADPRALFYPGFAPYYRGWLRLESSAGPEGTRIAYAGTNLPYYLLGLGLRNELKYVNIDRHHGWLMHDYHREAQRRGLPTWPSPWPAWDRLEPDYDAWLANLRAEAIDLLVVASMGRPAGSLPDEDREEFSIERRWAESHPESFEAIYGVKENDPKFRIYRLRPESRVGGDPMGAGRGRPSYPENLTRLSSEGPGKPSRTEPRGDGTMKNPGQQVEWKSKADR
jgi:hypothetical protein